MKHIILVRWGNTYNDEYNYGTVIEKMKHGQVKISSSFMPVGASIKIWTSFGSYQERRSSPQLPLLTRGKDYHCEIFMKIDGALFFAVEFYDKNDQLIDKLYFDNLSFEFHYPKEAVNYKIIMVNKRHQRLIFRALVITDLETAEKYQLDLIEEQGNLLLEAKEEEENDHQEIYRSEQKGSTFYLPLWEKARKILYILNQEKD